MAAKQPSYPSQIGDMSHTEYRHLTEDPYDWNDFLINRNELHHVHIGNPSPMYDSRNALASLGHFDKLPTEIFFMILKNLDLFSLMHLKVTNSRVRCIITGWEPFRELVTDASDVLRALLATNAAVMFTVPQISKAVFTTRCEFCGECGTFLQLVKLARCCFRCLATDRRLLSVPLSFAQTKMGLDGQNLPKIPHLTTIPRTKFWSINKDIRSFSLVDYTAALTLARPGPVPTVGSELEPYLSELPTIIRRRRQRAQAANQRRSGAIKRCGQSSVARPVSSYPIATVRPLVSAIDFNPLEHEPFRFLAAMHAPGISKTSVFNPQTKSYKIHKVDEVHKYCSGCRFAWNLISPRHPMEHTIFTKPELDAHLQTCFYARLRWDHLYPAGSTVDEARAILLSQNRRRNMFRIGFPGYFEMIPPRALYLYANSELVEDDRFGDLMLGLCDANSQASWATSGKHTAGILWRYVNRLIERKGRKGSSNSSWKQAAKFQVHKPRLGRPKILCQNGLPTSDTIHPDHTQVWDLNGEDVNLWFERDNTAYFEPWFLDSLSQ